MAQVLDLDLKGLTLAELHNLNRQLEHSRAEEAEWMKREYGAKWNGVDEKRKVEEAQFNDKRNALFAKFREDTDPITLAYKDYGMQIGSLVAKRHLCKTEEEMDEINAKIDGIMEQRHFLSVQRGEMRTKFHADLHDLKNAHEAERKRLHAERQSYERDLKQALLEIASKYSAKADEVRKRVAELRENAAETYGVC